jgi:hypothetical protein
MRLREARLLTALVVIAVCGLAVSRGLDIVRFSNAKAGIAAHEHRADAVRRWTAVPGLASAAWEVSLMDAIDPADIDAARNRGDELAASLSVRPLSSMKWLALASARVIMGQPFDKVLAALALSSLTGPNEGYVMSQRAIFGLVQWESLPEDVRKRTVADLVAAFLQRSISGQEADVAKGVLATKDAGTHQEIIDRLRSAGLPSNEIVRIGL